MGFAYVPCFAPFHRHQRTVPGRKPVFGCVTTSDSTLDCRQYEQMAGVSVNVKSSGYYSQSPEVGRLYSIRVRTIEGRRGHTLGTALLIRVCLTRMVIAHGGLVSGSLLPGRVFNTDRIIYYHDCDGVVTDFSAC